MHCALTTPEACIEVPKPSGAVIVQAGDHPTAARPDAGPGYLTIVECRPPWRKDLGPDWTRFPIARLHYTKATRRWSLYWRDRHLRFHRYDQLPASPRVDNLLQEIDRDPIAIFWG